MKARIDMQGMPVHNILKMPVKGNKQVSASNLSSAEIGGDNKSDNSEFASLIGLAQKDTQISNESPEKTLSSELVENLVKLKDTGASLADTVKNKKVSEDILTGKETVASNQSNLNKILNQLKEANHGNGNEEEIQDESSLELNKNIFPRQNLNEVSGKKESPLDFLVNGIREHSVSDNTSRLNLSEKQTKNAGQIFLIPNNLKSTLGSNEVSLKDETFTNEKITGKDFVDAKSNKKSDSDSEAFVQMMSKNNGKDVSKIKGYYEGQGLLNNTMIKSTKDLAFKETKKGKLDPVSELLSPELKVANELSSIKESVIPLINQKNSNSQNQEVAKQNNENLKVLDLSKININSKSDLIGKISDYIMQNNIAGKDQIDLTVKHDSLGVFQIQVTKNVAINQPNQIDMQIVTSNQEGHKFFVENESALVKSLQQSGLSLSDFRIVSHATEAFGNSLGSTLSDSKQFNSFNQNPNGSSSSQNFESFQSGNYREGQERRKDLWNEYRERLGA